MAEERTEDRPAGRGEESGMPLHGRRTVLKIGAIVLVAAGVVAFGMLEARIMPRLPRSFRVMPRTAPELEKDFPLPEGDLLMASETVLFNGMRGYHLRCVSPRLPGEVVASFGKILESRGFEPAAWERSAARFTPRKFFARFQGRGYAMMGWRDDEGRMVGVTAFLNPNSLGSDYFISRSEGPVGEVPERAADGDVPGGDIPGVVRPPSSSREFIIDKPGPKRSMMALYESSASAAMVQEWFRSKMAALRWEQPVGSAEVLSEHADGALLTFRRGDEYCHVNIVEDGDLCSVTLVYRTR
jgi:hypothetical protein